MSSAVSEIAASSPASPSTVGNSTASRVAWGLAAVLGAVLLVAGILKVIEPFDFVRQIASFQMLPEALHIPAAWFFLVVECSIGAALVIGYKLRWALIASAALTLVFMGALGYVKLKGIPVEDCGCFGSQVKRSPTAALVEDGLMLAAAVGALFLVGRSAMGNMGGKWRTGVVGLFAAFGLFTPLAFGFPVSSGNDFQNVKIQGVNVDLTKGEHLVVLMDTECSHCQENTPKINQLIGGGLPPMVALCSNEEWRRKFFTQRYGAKFPIGEISKDDFKRLLAEGDTPRIMLVKNGRTVKAWNIQPPTADEVKKARQ